MAVFDSTSLPDAFILGPFSGSDSNGHPAPALSSQTSNGDQSTGASPVLEGPPRFHALSCDHRSKVFDNYHHVLTGLEYADIGLQRGGSWGNSPEQRKNKEGRVELNMNPPG